MSQSDVCVLFADVSGSTRLYEEHGDEAARSAIAVCIETLTSVCERFNGRVVKTIGDEVMCLYDNPVRAVLSAGEMQLAVQAGGKQGRFVTGPLRIKIGMHFGPGIEQDSDVYGEASLLAQQVIKQAKADQVLASGEVFEAIPPELRFGTRPVDRVAAEGRDAPLDLVEMLWEVSDLTQMSDTGSSLPKLPDRGQLTLLYGDTRIELNVNSARLSIGRTEQNDFVVPTSLASRSHAEIEFRRGKFHLRDMSTNGTVVTSEDGESNLIRGDSVPLEGRGTFCLGGTPELNPDGTVTFEYEDV